MSANVGMADRIVRKLGLVLIAFALGLIAPVMASTGSA